MLVLFAAGAALVACSPKDASPPGPSSLRVVYRVEDSARLPVRVTTVVTEDFPPYRGRTRTLEGPPPGTKDLGGVAWDEAAQYLLGEGLTRTALHVPPGFAGTATGLDVALASAQRHGLVTRQGDVEVAGRACTEWLSREPLDSGTFAAARAGERTTSCVDSEGLLLRDVWELDGSVVRTRTAVSIGRGPSLAGGALLAGQTPSPAPTAGPFEQVKTVDRPVLLQALAIPEPPAPQGLSPDRSAAVIRLDPDGQVGVEGGVLTWTNGRRLVVLRLERGLTRRLAAPGSGVVVRLDATRTARLSPTPAGLRLTFGQGSFVVTVTGDLPEDVLLAWSASVPFGG